jgi:hypothetical protein
VEEAFELGQGSRRAVEPMMMIRVKVYWQLYVPPASTVIESAFFQQSVLYLSLFSDHTVKCHVQ